MSGAFAVTERLNSRGLNVDATCKLCNNADETINHVMFQCQPALDILESVQFPQDSSPPRSLVENFHLILKLLSEMSVMENYRTVIPWFLWAIWKNRNSIPGPAQREGQSVHRPGARKTRGPLKKKLVDPRQENVSITTKIYEENIFS